MWGRCSVSCHLQDDMSRAHATAQYLPRCCLCWIIGVGSIFHHASKFVKGKAWHSNMMVGGQHAICICLKLRVLTGMLLQAVVADAVVQLALCQACTCMIGINKLGILGLQISFFNASRQGGSEASKAGRSILLQQCWTPYQHLSQPGRS